MIIIYEEEKLISIADQEERFLKACKVKFLNHCPILKNG